ncbi:phytoene desaturase [Pontivivens insulae]|uniref:Phytoene dehydrogenase n=1 Tax=Pontivivens insulae TaxID=1639689 RepID=A0A2R8A9U5_9RHOB|nr:phytoene desaturase [Pontivivens insulae]RED12902.1 phytoene desaturase [Pontivivens insulae]SPF28994.1 Phytoene desaturase (neurosporene-forming) [Pontivivens insulae]
MLTRVDPHTDLETGSDTRPPAIVIGAGFGGLAAAMRLGAKGYRVTVIDRLDMVGGRASSITKAGHRFDLGPTIVTVPQVFRELWQATGRRFDDYVDLTALDPFYEIRWPDGSHFTASGSTEAMRAEVERLSPGDLKGYDRFLKDSERRYAFGFEDLGRRSMHKLWDLIKVLPTFGMLRADRSVLSHAKRRVRDKRLQMALSFHPLFIGGDPMHVTSMYILVSYLEKQFGVHYAQGGAGAIALAMARVIQEQGGRLMLDTEVSEITTDGDRVSGVRLADGDTLRAGLVVSNADAGHTYLKTLKCKKKRWTDRRLKSRTRWSMGLFVWYFGTKGTSDMWPGAGHHTILNGPRYEGLLNDIFIKGKLADDMSLYVHRPSVTDPSVAPDGDDTFYALSPVPHLGHKDPVNWAQEAESYRQKVQAVLEEQLLPGLGDHLTAQHILTPADFETRYLSPFGSAFSIEPRILQSAWFRPHNISEEIEGLYLVGAGTHPGAGLPGVIASAEVLGSLVPEAVAR